MLINFHTKIPTEKNQKLFQVGWHLTNVCSFRCSYCHPSNHEGSVPAPRFDIFEKTTNDIFAFCKKYDKTPLFSLIGGEISFIPQFEKYLAHLKKHKALIISTSNGAQDLNWWEENLKHFDVIEFSYHHEFSNPDHFWALAKLAEKEKRLFTHLHIMVKPNEFDKIYNFACRLRDEVTLSMNLSPLYRPDCPDSRYFDYSEDQWKLMREFKSRFKGQERSFDSGLMKILSDTEEKTIDTYQLIANDKNRFKGWQCYNGLESLNIDLYGQVFRARCKNSPALGSIFDQLPLDQVHAPEICLQEKCLCGLDLMIRKVEGRG